MLNFIGQILPYLAGGIFIAGMGWRLWTWLRTPVPFKMTLSPAPVGTAQRFIKIGQELLIFKTLRQSDRRLWLWAWMMHLCLAAIIGGHITGIYFLGQQFTALGLSINESVKLSTILGSLSGILIFASLVALLYRRTSNAEVKRLSDPADYFDILLLLAVVISGLHMRLTSLEVDLPAIRTYLGSLMTFKPVSTPQNWIFISHYFLVNILLAYLPFSKMLHMTGFFVNKAMMTATPPVYPSSLNASNISAFRKGGVSE
ncbi:respiratory nitrate reductase subunit gamma [Dendrosporobacter sp. 1207_IL3150]|uniref:respiratory nitrate reductase subunit gamma n=1 Tax=Dendrosporobacter sp. 1207_IL3150 TaxID=3084054 RepID=UPI002FDB37DB